MIKQSVARITFVLVLLCSSLCFAWSRDGQKIVGKIASAHLTPETQSRVRALLSDEPLADVSIGESHGDNV